MNARMLVSERPQRVSRKRGAATRTGSYHRLPVTASPGVPRRCPRAAELGGGAPLRAWPARFALWHPRLVRRRRSRRGSGHRAKHLGRGFGPGATICCCSFSGRVAWRVAFVRGGGIFVTSPHSDTVAYIEVFSCFAGVAITVATSIASASCAAFPPY